MSAIDRLFHFGTWVPEVWRNTIQRKEHEKDFEQALAEVHSLRKVLVMADRLLTEVETDGAIGYEHQKNMRAEINKAMSFTLNDEAAQHSVQATVAAPWACPSCSHENHAMAIKCYFCDATAPNA